MHRAYQPVTPANNIFLKQRWDQDIYQKHRKKVQTAMPRIDNKPPKTYMHLHIKLKKLQMEGERLAIVERDNRILLEKMAHIMRTDGVVDDCKHDYVKKSLNKTKRQRELLRITHENMAILKRITTKEPHYTYQNWQQLWQVNEGYMMNISKYRHSWRSDQESYLQRKVQQAAANRRINQQVIEHQNMLNQNKRATQLLLTLQQDNASLNKQPRDDKPGTKTTAPSKQSTNNNNSNNGAQGLNTNNNTRSPHTGGGPRSPGYGGGPRSPGYDGGPPSPGYDGGPRSPVCGGGPRSLGHENGPQSPSNGGPLYLDSYSTALSLSGSDISSLSLNLP